MNSYPWTPKPWKLKVLHPQNMGSHNPVPMLGHLRFSRRSLSKGAWTRVPCQVAPCRGWEEGAVAAPVVSPLGISAGGSAELGHWPMMWQGLGEVMLKGYPASQLIYYRCFQNRGGPPKWMVKIMEKPYGQMDDLGGKPTSFGNIHIGGWWFPLQKWSNLTSAYFSMGWMKTTTFPWYVYIIHPNNSRQMHVLVVCFDKETKRLFIHRKHIYG